MTLAYYTLLFTSSLLYENICLAVILLAALPWLAWRGAAIVYKVAAAAFA